MGALIADRIRTSMRLGARKRSWTRVVVTMGAKPTGDDRDW